MVTEQVIKVGLLYNAFDPSDIVKEELVYDEGKPLSHYIEGLPDTCDWAIGLNGIPVKPEDFDHVIPVAQDAISLVVVPRGGGFKDILRMIAMIAVVVAGAFLFGPVAGGLALAGGGIGGIAAMTAFIAVGSLLVNMAIPPSGIKTDTEDTTSYGYDGAKNTAKEGVPIPVVYGLFEVAGNYVDIRTENINDDQYMFGRLVLSDGEIEGVVGEPTINEQPISNYDELTWGSTVGAGTENENPNFQRSVGMYQRNDKLDTGWTSYTTHTAVEGFQVNTGFPGGLVRFDKKGKKHQRAVTLEVQYSPSGLADWSGPGGVLPTVSNNPNGVTITPWGTTKFKTTAAAGTGPTVDLYDLEYRETGTSGPWIKINTYTEPNSSYTYQPTFNGNAWQGYDSFGNVIPSATQVTTSPTEVTTTVSLPPGTYDFRTTGGGIIKTITTKEEIAPGAQGATSVTYSDNRAKALRKTFEVTNLPLQHYDIRVRRTTEAIEEAGDDRISEECHLIEIGEILNSNVPLRSVATGFFKVKMTDQLSGIPSITWPVKGVKVPIYDANGNVLSTSWSDNPADIVLDMLISPLRGSLRGRLKVDFAAFKEWRDFCEDNSFKFNGVFDETESLWDALAQVFRCGRATPTRIGTKLSVAIDKPTTPVMLFGPGNIFKDTFNISYIPLTDRANEFEVSYFDKDDHNKQKTLRVADPATIVSGEIPKTASYVLRGVDNFEQAEKEIWYQLYNNRLTKRLITFDAPIESIGLSLGDVAYIQHDMVEWGTAGRIKSSPAINTIVLDKPITIEPGENYSVLVIHDKLLKFSCGFTQITGFTYTLTGMAAVDATEEECKRIQTNTGDEAAILAYDYQGANTAVVTLDRAITGTTATVWDVDVVEERSVANAAGYEGDTIIVHDDFTASPNPYSNYSFGISTFVKKPYRLRSINGEGFDRRTLAWGEYNELVYSPPGYNIPAPTPKLPNIPSHVQHLTMVVDPVRRGGGNVAVTVSWTSGHILNYAGADVYVSINDAEYVFYKTVLNTNECFVEMMDGDSLQVKVIAFNTKMMRADQNIAPSTQQTMVTAAGTLAVPTAIGWETQSVEYLATGLLSWTKPEEGPDVNVGPITRVMVKTEGATKFDDKGTTTEDAITINSLPAGTHMVRIRAENGTGAVSNWVFYDIVVDVDAPIAPVFLADALGVDHVKNTDGSVTVSLEFSYSGDEADISGFEITTYVGDNNTQYDLGDSEGAENAALLTPNKRAIVMQGIPADKFYSFFVRSFKRVHPSFSATGVVYSTASRPSGTEIVNGTYQPETNVAFQGNFEGTIDGFDVADINKWDAITGTGKPQDGATKNVLRGPWAAATSYAVGDMFTWEGQTYGVVVAHFSFGTSPDMTKVILLAAKGENGASGESAIGILMSLDNGIVPADSDGIVASYAGLSGIQIRVFSGSINVSNSYTLSTSANTSNFTVSYDNTQTLYKTFSITGAGTSSGNFGHTDENVGTLRILLTPAGGSGLPNLIKDFKVTKNRAANFDSTPPAIPTGLGLTSAIITESDGSQWAKVTAAWTNNTETDLAGYVLAIQEASGSFVEFRTNASTNTFYWRAQPNVTYTAKIASFDKTNNRSGFSSTQTILAAKDTTPPAAPVMGAAETSFKSVFLTWTNPADIDVTYIEVFEHTTSTILDAHKVFTVPASAANQVQKFVRENVTTTKYYAVKAVDGSGNKSVLSNVIGATPATQLINNEIADYAISFGKFGADLSALERVTSLPSTGNYYGRYVMLTTTNKVYRWIGAGTKESPVTGTASWDTSADASDLTVGTLSADRIAVASLSGDKIAANTITAKNMLIGDWTNLCANGQILGDFDWTLGTGMVLEKDVTNGYSGRQWTMRIDPTAGTRYAVNSNNFPVVAGEKFFLNWWGKARTTLTGSVTVEVIWYNAAGSIISTSAIGVLDTELVYSEFAGEVTAPANTVEAITRVTATNTAGIAQIGEIYLVRRNGAKLIVDGSITTQQISAANVNADMINTGTLAAARISAVASTVTVGSGGTTIGDLTTGTARYRTTGAPTNNPTPSGITITDNANGTRSIRLDWAAYTQGAVTADTMIIFWNKTGTAPTVNDAAVTFNVNTSGSSFYVFDGLLPTETFSFGIAAARSSNVGLEIGAIQCPTSAPDWLGVATGSVNFTGNINGTAAATVVTNASNGNTAATGTAKYRQAGAPTNNPTPNNITITANTNGTRNIRVSWAAYTQGTNQADMLMLFWNKTSTAPTINDSAISFNVNTSADSYYIFEGVNPEDAYSIGISAVRRTESGLEIGAIQAPTSAPQWVNITATTANYTANIDGSSAATVKANAALGAIHPTTRINDVANTTKILPGKIEINGSTTLSSWISSGDTSTIAGGAIDTNSITANKMTIGARGLALEGVQFAATRDGTGNLTNVITWTAGSVTYWDTNATTKDPELIVKTISSGSATYSGSSVYIYYTRGGTTLSSTNTQSTANGVDKVVFCTYSGGSNFVANYGSTIIDGDNITTNSLNANKIKTGTLTATQIAAGTITADKMNVTNLGAVSANIGIIRTANTGARMQIEDNVIFVYDTSNVLRVQLGDLSKTASA